RKLFIKDMEDKISIIKRLNSQSKNLKNIHIEWHEKRESEIVKSLQISIKRILYFLREKKDRKILPLVYQALFYIKEFKEEDHKEIEQRILQSQIIHHQVALTFWGGIFLFLALSIAFIMLVQKNLILPILELKKMAGAIKEKNFTYSFQYQNQDEIGELKKSLEEMAGELKEFYQSLERKVQAQAQLLVRSEKLASLGTLVAGIAHEINNPLATISICAESLLKRGKEDKPFDKDREEYLSLILEETLRCKKITGDLLEFARYNEVQFEEVNLLALLEKALVFFEWMEKNEPKKVHLHSFLPKKIGPIQGEPNQLLQVFINLLKNAYDALEEGGNIYIKVQELSKTIQVKIWDDGAGIEKENLPRIWDPFFTTKKVGHGTGLGLPITHTLLEGHGAQIEIESEGKGKGTMVKIVFPKEHKDKEG
ncbi:MAG: HAMP domain-containing protein, partial [Planctomycetota bacterium]